MIHSDSAVTRNFLCSFLLYATATLGEQHHQAPYPISAWLVSPTNDRFCFYFSNKCTLVLTCTNPVGKGAQECNSMPIQANPTEKPYNHLAPSTLVPSFSLVTLWSVGTLKKPRVWKRTLQLPPPHKAKTGRKKNVTSYLKSSLINEECYTIISIYMKPKRPQFLCHFQRWSLCHFSLFYSPIIQVLALFLGCSLAFGRLSKNMEN